MLLRAQLRALVAQQMQVLSVAGGNVVENRATPASAAQLPIVVLTTPMERKASRGPGAPQFDTSIGLAADIRVTGTTDDVLDRLEAVMEAVELALMSNATIMQYVQEIASVESASEADLSGNAPIGKGRLMFEVVLQQVYNPALLQPLTQVQATVGADGTTSGSTVSLQIPPSSGS